MHLANWLMITAGALGILLWVLILVRTFWVNRQRKREAEAYSRAIARNIIEECQNRRMKLENERSIDFVYPIFGTQNNNRECVVWARMTVTKRSISGSIECADIVGPNGQKQANEIRAALRLAGVNTIFVKNAHRPSDEELTPSGEKIDGPA